MKTTDAGASRSRFIALAACLSVPAAAWAQPYHTDILSGGVQTLKVDGDVSIEQYSGTGGNLKVVGDASFAKGGVALSGLPSGVTGTYYGTHKIGTSLNTAEYRFSKTGTEITGDFTVPLGRFGDWEGGAVIQLEVLTGPADNDSGGAQYTLMAKRHASQGKVTAVTHSAFAGGRGVKIHAHNEHGSTWLFLEFDATSNHPGESHEHSVIVRVSSIGTIDPHNRNRTLVDAYPVDLENSYDNSSITVGETTQSINTDKIALNGDVTVAAGKTLKIGTSDVVTTADLDAAIGIGGGGVGGTNSVALSASYAYGNQSVAIGGGSYTEGTGSMAASGGTALGDYSVALSSGSISWGLGSFAAGFATADAENAAALSRGTASGIYSTAFSMGRAEGNVTVAAGNEVRATAGSSVAFGSSNTTDTGSPTSWVETDRIFTIGNGLPPVKSDAISTLKNGQTSLINKAWKGVQNGTPAKALGDPSLSTTDSAGEALVVEGHTRLRGKVVIEVPQGDVSMGIYE